MLKPAGPKIDTNRNGETVKRAKMVKQVKNGKAAKPEGSVKWRNGKTDKTGNWFGWPNGKTNDRAKMVKSVNGKIVKMVSQVGREKMVKC